jgi:hypothetical protein
MSERESAGSHLAGTLLMIVITIILASLVLLMALGLPNLWMADDEIPTVFRITQVTYTAKYGGLKYACHVVVKNCGDTAWDNRKLSAKTYRNGHALPCVIPYINFQGYINNKPLGIQTIGGMGTNNYAWVPEAMVWIDYAQGTFRPGDSILFEVFDRDTGRIISRDTYPPVEVPDEKKWMKQFLSRFSRQGA